MASATTILMGLTCVVYICTLNMECQALNVTRMRMLRTKVTSVTSGGRSLKDAVNKALRDWVTNNVRRYLTTSWIRWWGPHPFPVMMRDFQVVIGREARVAFILFMTGGFPDRSAFREIVLALDRAGADIIELGVPFSDPLVDGPVIQIASTQALT